MYTAFVLINVPLFDILYRDHVLISHLEISCVPGIDSDFMTIGLNPSMLTSMSNASV